MMNAEKIPPKRPDRCHEHCSVYRKTYESAPKTPKTDFTGLQLVENQ